MEKGKDQSNMVSIVLDLRAVFLQRNVTISCRRWNTSAEKRREQLGFTLFHIEAVQWTVHIADEEIIRG